MRTYGCNAKKTYAEAAAVCSGGLRKIGDGYCFGNQRTERPYRILSPKGNEWVQGDLDEAMAACEANGGGGGKVCVGVHYDGKTREFALLTKVGNPNGQDRGTRSCYLYVRDKGLRLCTAQEIADGRTSGTGCGYDTKRVWTSSTSTSAATPGLETA